MDSIEFRKTQPIPGGLTSRLFTAFENSFSPDGIAGNGR